MILQLKYADLPLGLIQIQHPEPLSHNIHLLHCVIVQHQERQLVPLQLWIARIIIVLFQITDITLLHLHVKASVKMLHGYSEPKLEKSRRLRKHSSVFSSRSREVAQKESILRD
jgi:hypothetical protein